MSQPIVGYLLHRFGCIEGDMGLGYNYILSGNGIFIWAQNYYLDACIPVAGCQIRGLTETEAHVKLIHGKIPQALFDLALNTALVKKEKEVYFALTWDNGYHLFLTGQQGEVGQVKYTVVDNTVMDIHSHGKIGTWVSHTDDKDEQGFKLSCLVGDLDKVPRVGVRIGVYGNFLALPWGDVFNGSLTGAVDVLKDYEEEVKAEIELSSTNQLQQDLSCGGWWNRFFGSRWIM